MELVKAGRITLREAGEKIGVSTDRPNGFGEQSRREGMKKGLPLSGKGF